MANKLEFKIFQNEIFEDLRYETDHLPGLEALVETLISAKNTYASSSK